MTYPVLRAFSRRGLCVKPMSGMPETHMSCPPEYCALLYRNPCSKADDPHAEHRNGRLSST